MIPVLLVTAIGTAGASIAVQTAQRTADAYADHLEEAAVGDLVLNPAVSTLEIDRVIQSLPGATRVTSDTAFATTLGDGRPRTRQEVVATTFELVVHGSSDGKYVDMDRPTVIAGRMPSARAEAVITSDAVARLGLAVGDTVPLAFWQPAFSDNAGSAFLADPAFGRAIIDPLGVEQLEIVGIVIMPGQLLPDDLVPRADMIVSPQLAADYDCLPTTPATGGTVAEARDALLPAGCALNYRYYSVSLADGAAGVQPAVEEFVRRSAPLNVELADLSDFAAAGILPPQYYPVATETAVEARRVDRAVQPVVATLLVLGAASVAVTLALVGLAMARQMRRTRIDQRQWQELAVGRGVRSVVLALPGAAAVLAGVLLGMLFAALMSPGARGVVRLVAPPRSAVVSGPILGAGAVLAGLAVAVVVAAAVRSTGRSLTIDDGATTTRLAVVVPVGMGPPDVSEGVRSAVGSRSAAPTIAASALLVGSLVAAVVFGSSLTMLVSTPTSYGWPWDVAALTGYGYGDLDVAATRTLLDGEDDVDGWVVFGAVDVFLADRQVPALGMLQSTADVALPLLAGRAPDADDEIALGASTAADLGLEVGDELVVALADPVDVEAPATVTGIVVFPSVGPFLADRVGAGTGVLLPERFVRRVYERSGFDPADYATFVGVELRPGTDGAAERIGRQLGDLAVAGTRAITYREAVRPPELIDLRATRSVSVIVTGVLAAMGVVGLVFASWASTRARRRELAVLRTLGFTRGQVRRSVRVQSCATSLAATVVGVPLGVVVGRLLWRNFAERLGVLPDPASAWLPLLAVAVGGVLAAVLAAQLPAVLATRGSAAAGLRTE